MIIISIDNNLNKDAMNNFLEKVNDNEDVFIIYNSKEYITNKTNLQKDLFNIDIVNSLDKIMICTDNIAIEFYVRDLYKYKNNQDLLF